MIQSLQIKNLAIVENVRIEFDPGLNIITGETGAGKSILIGALGLILGDRADKTMIRAGEEECGVEAVFELSDLTAVNAILDEFGLPSCEEGCLIIRRVISSTGAGRILVNDTGVTLQSLKRLGDLLVDIHGAHDHQSLINGSFQLALLDDYGGLSAEVEKFGVAFNTVKALEKKIFELNKGGEEDVERQVEVLEFQMNEIRVAGIEEGEEEAILREHAVLGNAQRILESAQRALNALTEDERSAFNCVVDVQQALGDIDALVEKSGGWKQEARSIAVQVQELSNEISGFVQQIDKDPARLQWLDERLATYKKLKRKYGNTVQDVLDHMLRCEELLRELQSRDERIKKMEAERDTAIALMEKQGVKLNELRSLVAKRLSTAIMRELRSLGFPHGSFEIALRDIRPVLSGMNEVEFQFAPNKGEPLRALKIIASSGEISRVMLAVKSVLAAHDKVPVMVFDEIDVNIGGTTARAVGFKLSGLAVHRQILCITHLPQVAVHGSSHFSVAKEVKKGRTTTGIARLAGEARVEEIARMLGGRDSTGVTLKHAQELLNRAEESCPVLE